MSLIGISAPPRDPINNNNEDEEDEATRLRGSINVLSDGIMLYKAGASSRSLGAIDKFGTPELNALLASAAEEFGQLMQEASV